MVSDSPLLRITQATCLDGESAPQRILLLLLLSKSKKLDVSKREVISHPSIQRLQLFTLVRASGSPLETDRLA